MRKVSVKFFDYWTDTQEGCREAPRAAESDHHCLLRKYWGVIWIFSLPAEKHYGLKPPPKIPKTD